MPGLLRMTIKEANDLADLIEEKGGTANSLRVVINDVNDGKNAHSSIPANKVDDEEHILWLRSQSAMEEGEDLECLVCHEKFSQLISGTCEGCFREWALTVERRPVMKELL